MTELVKGVKMTNQHKMTEQELYESAQFALEARGGLKQTSMTEHIEYKAGTSFEFPVPNHKIEFVKLTEQQILDKTIEYLNKYDAVFTDWKVNKIGAIKCFAPNGLAFYLNSNYQPIIANPGEIARVMASEFRIAYNIIKDLAQHEPNALG